MEPEMKGGCGGGWRCGSMLLFIRQYVVSTWLECQRTLHHHHIYIMYMTVRSFRVDALTAVVILYTREHFEQEQKHFILHIYTLHIEHCSH